MISASFEDDLLDEDGEDASGSVVARRKGLRFRRSHFTMMIGVGALLWAIFAWGVMPRLITNAYDGHGPSILVKGLAHKSAYPLEHYLAKWNKLALGALAAWMVAGSVYLVTTSRWFAKNVAKTATPGTLGALRMAICLILAWVTWWMRLVEMTALPVAQRHTMGVMDFFYATGWGHVVGSAVLVQTLKWACIGLCLLGAIGYRTRLVLPAIVLLYLPLAGITRSYFWFNHCGIVPWYCLIVLCFTRCSDGWSVDRLLRIARGQAVPDAKTATSYYGWARLFVWLCVCIPYFLAGISKLVWASPYWWTGNNMQAILFADGLRPGGETLAMQLTWLPTWFFTLMGIGTIIGEVGYITVPFLRLSRYTLPVAMFSMHLGIWIVMGINFYDLLLIQWIFFSWTPLVRWIGQRLQAKRGSITVLFDGHCPLCQRTIRVVRALDILGRLRPTDFRKADLPAIGATHGVPLDPARLEREMIVIRSGEAFGGAQGARVIAGALPALWIVYPLLAIPGLSHASAAVYRIVARNRMSLLKCDPAGACSIERPATPVQPTPPAPTRPHWLRRLAPGVGVATMFCCMLGWWTTKLEWYPITCMQMFTWYSADKDGKPTSVVNYYRAYAIYEDGSKTLVKFNQMGGGVAMYQNALAKPFLSEVPQRIRDEGKAACIELMTTSANWWNTHAATPGRRIVRMETHHRTWDFVKQRDDYGNWGSTLELVGVDIPPPSGARLASGN